MVVFGRGNPSKNGHPDSRMVPDQSGPTSTVHGRSQTILRVILWLRTINSSTPLSEGRSPEKSSVFFEKIFWTWGVMKRQQFRSCDCGSASNSTKFRQNRFSKPILSPAMAARRALLKRIHKRALNELRTMLPTLRNRQRVDEVGF